MGKSVPLLERFWSKVTRRGDDECWGWTGGKVYFGYGAIHFTPERGKKIQKKAHRLSWEVHFGDIPQGMFVCHKCDNTECTNPRHLFLGTAQDNQDDMNQKGRNGSHKWDHRGNGTGQAKVNETTVKEIRELYSAGGQTIRSVGKKYGLGHATVVNIINRKSWSHVA